MGREAAVISEVELKCIREAIAGKQQETWDKRLSVTQSRILSICPGAPSTPAHLAFAKRFCDR